MCPVLTFEPVVHKKGLFLGFILILALVTISVFRASSKSKHRHNIISVKLICILRTIGLPYGTILAVIDFICPIISLEY